jgi:hypothetical protein
MATTAPTATSHRAARPRVDWTAAATAVLVYLVAFLLRLWTLMYAVAHGLWTTVLWLTRTVPGLALTLALTLLGAALVWRLGAVPSDPLEPGPARMTGYGDYGPPDAGTGGRLQVDTSRIHEPSTGRLP